MKVKIEINCSDELMAEQILEDIANMIKRGEKSGNGTAEDEFSGESTFSFEVKS